MVEYLSDAPFLGSGFFIELRGGKRAEFFGGFFEQGFSAFDEGVNNGFVDGAHELDLS